MKSVWTNHIKDKDLSQIHASGLKHDIYIKQLRDILGDREKELVTSLISTPEGDAWPFKQAHLNGRLSMLREVQSLLNFDQG